MIGLSRPGSGMSWPLWRAMQKLGVNDRRLLADLRGG
jgi:hypothetical protein